MKHLFKTKLNKSHQFELLRYSSLLIFFLFGFTATIGNWIFGQPVYCHDYGCIAAGEIEYT